MPKYTNKRYRYVTSIHDINYILQVAAIHTTITYGEHSIKAPTRYTSYVEDKQRYIRVTTRYVKDINNKDGSVEYTYADDYVCTWMFDKTGKENYHMHPSRVARLSNNAYTPLDIIKKQPDLFYRGEDGKILESAKPILGFNPKFDNTEHQVYCYDLNSAYAAVLRDKIIDTYNFRCDDVVKENEVGFMFNNDLTMVSKGYIADYVFPLIDSPYKEFCDKWYKIKKKSPKGSREKAEAKDVLVITVGLFQLHNPFLRAYVVNSCNKKIEDIVKANYDHVCCWNTDAVYSDIPLDLELGDNVGQFKLEYQGLFRQKGNNYQKVNDDAVSYRGVCNVLFKKGWNLLTDPLPENYLPYKYNMEKNLVEVDSRYVEEI